MKLLLIGNCQARPLGQLLAPKLRAELLPPIVLHKARPEHALGHERQLQQADVILAQLTSENFEPAHLRTSRLLVDFASKLVTWPNLFFIGQQPFLRYLTQPGIGRVMGPLESYHDLRLLRRWLAETRGEDWRPDIEEPDYASKVSANSLKQLEIREARADVQIADVIAERYARRRLFYTFNHPSSFLLARLGERILAHLGAPDEIEEKTLPDPLKRTMPPSNLPGPGGARIRGYSVDLQADGEVALSKTLRAYTPENLATATFDCYRHRLADTPMGAFRLTPDL